MKFLPVIRFNGQCDEALELYKRAFGCTVRTLLHYSDAVQNGWEQPDPDQDGRVYHSEVMFDEQEVRFCDSTEEDAELSRRIMHAVSFESAEKVRTAFEVLSEGGEIINPLESKPYLVIMGTVRDRFGIPWNLFCDFQ